jgi:Aspartyl/Asparaginyl beta-hydroxylase
MGQAGPGWAKGYDVEDLKRITALFERHDEGMVHGTFDRYSGHDAVDDLRSGALSLGPREGDGVPAWACVVRELDRTQPVQDFTGARMTLAPGTLSCTRMAFGDESVAAPILHRLAGYDGAIAVECWQEHAAEHALVSRLLDVRLGAVKIKASSSMRGVWVSRGVEGPPRAEQDLLGLAELPLALPQDAILALSSHPTVCDGGATWTAIRGFYDEPERVEKPGEMNRRWKSEHAADLDREPRDTPLRARLGPALEEILAALPCAGFERIRLMRLEPGGGIPRHSDIADPDAGASVGKVVRVHIPLVSNDRCVFECWGLDGATGRMAMRPGTAVYLDRRKPHATANTGDTPAIHLVADCYASEATAELLRNI